MSTIKSKIVTNIVIILLTIIAIVGMTYSDLHRLSGLKSEMSKRAKDAVAAKEASMGGVVFYQFIADCVINRDLSKVEKDWPEIKKKVFNDIDITIKSADTADEEKWSKETKTALLETVSLFENKLLPLLKGNNGITPEIREIDGKIDKQVGLVESTVDKVVNSLQNEMQEIIVEFDKEIQKALFEVLAIGAIGLLLQAGMAAWLIKTILRPIKALQLMLTDISHGEGDLTKKLDDTTRDELAEISKAFNLFVEKLRSIIGNIASTSSQVASASVQLKSTSEKIAAGAENVVVQSSSVATAGEEMSATSGDIAQSCQRAAEGALLASQTAKEGSAVVEKNIFVMGEIAHKVQETAKAVGNLGTRSDQIGDIVETIENIADQTNLLALNAAIEAARAGEQGRGFAVVADEVRALAERTTKATREIGEMIKAIQSETKGAVIAMEEGVLQVQAGTAEAAKSGQALAKILQQVNEVSELVSQIATAAEEQTATTSEISNNMHLITTVVQETSMGAHESSMASAQLQGNAEELQRLVSQFKL